MKCRYVKASNYNTYIYIYNKIQFICNNQCFSFWSHIYIYIYIYMCDQNEKHRLLHMNCILLILLCVCRVALWLAVPAVRISAPTRAVCMLLWTWCSGASLTCVWLVEMAVWPGLISSGRSGVDSWMSLSNQVEEWEGLIRGREFAAVLNSMIFCHISPRSNQWRGCPNSFCVAYRWDGGLYRQWFLRDRYDHWHWLSTAQDHRGGGCHNDHGTKVLYMPKMKIYRQL